MKNYKLLFLSFKFVNQPPRVMDGKGGLTFPNIRNNTVQSSVTGAFSINIAHNTKIPNFKFWLYILRGYGTSFGKVVKRKVVKFCIRNSRSIGEEKIPSFATTRSRDRFTYNGGGCRLLTVRRWRGSHCTLRQRGGRYLLSW